MKRASLVALCLAWAMSSTAGADWKPAAGPLMTKWAKEVSPEKVHPEYPRPQLVRKEWKNLNGLWQLAFAKEGEQPPVGKELPERILVPFPVESALSGVMKRAERLWYRYPFEVPAGWSGQRVLLHFGAVDWEATVYVNGKKLGEHRGGYDAFSFDITDALNKSGAQELIVGVWDPTSSGTQPRGKQVNNPKGIYYTPTTGIWQTVWLEAVPSAYIERLKITPDFESKQVKVEVTAVGTKGLSAEVKILDGSKEVAASNAQMTAGAEGRSACTIAQRIPGAKPWSPESPYLYDLEVTLYQQESRTDRVLSYCAMRQVAIGKDDKGITRLLLNGKPYFQVGPLDQGFWPDGLYTAPTDAALKYDIEVTKQLGFNMTRKHVKVEPARWYYWCDKLGLLVWQDMPSGEKSVARGKGEMTRSPESAKQFERELKAMIDAFHNHPCIVMWVVFNEGWGQYDTARLTEWTKEYDPTRLVNGASGWNDMRVGDVHDMHLYPGPGSPELESARAAVLGEFGGLALRVEGHTWSKEIWGYQNTRSSAELTRKYERLLQGVYRLKDKPGLSAAIYTQITDVETEANGLLTYDRAAIKVDVERIAGANRGDFSRMPPVRVVVPTSQEKGQTWRYTVEKPADGWFQPGFDDAKWKEGPGGFGTTGTPGAVVRTEWKTPDIWLRREFMLPKGPVDDLWFALHHDEDAEIYLNGVLAASVRRFTTGYLEESISAEARAALKPGKNALAVHCKQTGGGQYIDVGLVEMREPKR